MGLNFKLAFLAIIATSLCFGQTAYQLLEFTTNASTLSITGFSFSNDAGVPEWIERAFGRRAMFWNKTTAPAHAGGIQRAISNYRRGSDVFIDVDQSNGDAAARGAGCSIEILGFVRIGSAKPFRGAADRESAPSVGKASLHSSDWQLAAWPCYYRGLYTNWPRVDTNDTFWAVLFFCPAPAPNHCVQFKSLYTQNDAAAGGVEIKNVKLELRMFLTELTWKVTMHTTSRAMQLPKASASTSAVHNTIPLAVCTAWPYTPQQHSIERMNHAIVFEFLLHYYKLGIRLFIYDRNGAVMRGVLDSSYARAQADERTLSALRDWMDYHNYTMQSRLSPRSGAARSVGEQPWSETMLLDHDKMLTYAHCRFHAATHHRIRRVLVVDFDEFVYCRQAEKAAPAQRRYLEKLLSALERRGKDQVMLSKTTVALRADGNVTVEQCVGEALRRADAGSEGSILDCFASVEHTLDVPNVKSVQLNFKCPFSGLHYACSPCYHQKTDAHDQAARPHHHSPPHNGSVNPGSLKGGLSAQCDSRHQNHKFSDCVCESTRRTACEFVHLSVQQEKYAAMRGAAGSSSRIARTELWDVIHS